MTNPQNYPRKRQENFFGSGESGRWPTYLGITGLLLFILVALAGGIIWCRPNVQMSVPSNLKMSVSAAF